MFTTNLTKFDREFPFPPISVDEAYMAYEKVLDFAGPDMAQRDWADTNIVGNVRNQTGQILSVRPTLSLVGWWKGESNAWDSAGTNNGALVNATYTNGIVGTAFSFDPESYPNGTYCGLEIPDSPAYALTNAFTIEGWVRPRQNGYVIFWRGDISSLDPYSLSMQGNTTLNFTVTGSSGANATLSATLPYNNWYHVGATYNHGVMMLYTNGVLAAQTITAVVPVLSSRMSDKPGIGVGNVNDGQNNFPFIGDDEIFPLQSRFVRPRNPGHLQCRPCREILHRRGPLSGHRPGRHP